MPPVKRRPRRRVGRPVVNRRHRLNQPGGQFGLIAPILKIVAPLVAGELAKLGIQKGLKKLTGKGMAGNGLLLAGQRRGRGPGRAANGAGSAAMKAKMARLRAMRKPARRRRRRKPVRGKRN